MDLTKFYDTFDRCRVHPCSKETTYRMDVTCDGRRCTNCVLGGFYIDENYLALQNIYLLKPM